jgi:hypothetical protein
MSGDLAADFASNQQHGERQDERSDRVAVPRLRLRPRVSRGENDSRAAETDLEH